MKTKISRFLCCKYSFFVFHSNSRNIGRYTWKGWCVTVRYYQTNNMKYIIIYLGLQSEDVAVELRWPLVSRVFVDLQLLQLALRQPQLLRQRLGVQRLLLQVLLNTTHTHTHTRFRPLPPFTEWILDEYQLSSPACSLITETLNWLNDTNLKADNMLWAFWGIWHLHISPEVFLVFLANEPGASFAYIYITTTENIMRYFNVIILSGVGKCCIVKKLQYELWLRFRRGLDTATD